MAGVHSARGRRLLRDRTGHFLWIELSADREGLSFTVRDEPPQPGTLHMMWVPSRQWRDVWSFVGSDAQLQLRTGSLIGPSHAGHIELVRRLIEPHVRLSAQFEVEMPWPGPEYPMLVRAGWVGASQPLRVVRMRERGMTSARDEALRAPRLPDRPHFVRAAKATDLTGGPAHPGITGAS